MGSGQAVVDIKELTKKYGKFVALDRLTLSVERGEILGFVGPNGAGKTTTIKILVGLARPTSGSASVAGADCVAETRKIKRLVGYMPDTFGSYDNMRVFEYLDFFGAAFGIPRRQRARRIDEVLETASASDFRDLFVEALSHGMKQRVAVARTLLHDPAVLILDEPTVGLDVLASRFLRDFVRGERDRGKAVVFSTHYLAEAELLCDRIGLIHRGRLLAEGTPEELRARAGGAASLEEAFLRFVERSVGA